MQTILGLHATRNLRLPKFAPGEFVPRYHKYALGADLRRQAYAVCRGVVVANGERDGRLAAVEPRSIFACAWRGCCSNTSRRASPWNRGRPRRSPACRHGGLRAVFELSPATDRLWARAAPASVTLLVGQARFFRRRFPGFTLVVQRGHRLAVLPAERPVAALHQADSVRIAALSRLLRSLRRMRRPHVLVLERGYLKTGFKRRVFHSLWWPTLQAVTSPSFRPFDEINPHPQPLSQRARGAQGTDHVC